MELPSKEIFELLQNLFPGFLALWVFHSYTAHPQRTIFDRVVQALILTLLVQCMSPIARTVMTAIGQSLITVGARNVTTDLIVSFVIAILLGLLLAVCSNNNIPHRIMPKWITKRTAYPSQWFSAFSQKEQYVYLTLKGSRRIRGWAEEWPDSPESGHFVLNNAQWIVDDSQTINLKSIDSILIRVEEVKFVEFDLDKSPCVGTITDQEGTNDTNSNDSTTTVGNEVEQRSGSDTIGPERTETNFSNAAAKKMRKSKQRKG